MLIENKGKLTFIFRPRPCPAGGDQDKEKMNSHQKLYFNLV